MLNEATEVSEISEEALAGKGRPAKQEIKCRNCLGYPKVGHSWDKHCRLYIPGKSKYEMKSALEKQKAKNRKERLSKQEPKEDPTKKPIRPKTDPTKKPVKPNVSARKPVPGDAVLKESASGSRPEPLESREQAEAESGLPEEPSADKIPQNPSDLFENDEAWEKARDSLPEPPREEEVSGIPEDQVAGLPDE